MKEQKQTYKEVIGKLKEERAKLTQKVEEL